MLRAMIRRNSRRTIVAGSLVMLLILAFIGYGYAAYRVQRPITDGGGVVLQTHLWGEGNPSHRGIDFVYPRGTDVYAVANGTVVDLDEDNQDEENVSEWGNFVLIRHEQRHYDRTTAQWAYVYSMYIHLKQWSVQVTETSHVNAGDWIAEVDRTGEGAGTQDHLHLQIVVHPQLDRTLDPFTLDSENRSRNPELWLAPYNSNTGTVVGKVTNVNGNPVGGLLVYGLQKQAGWGYGSNRTYNNAALKPDDILVENWGTTDVTPGTYTITLSNGSNMGRHTVQAGQITYVGLYPVWLPKVRGNYNDWNSTVVVRNNSSTFTAQVNTTFFKANGEVQQQRTDYIAPNTVTYLPAPTPPEGFYGSAVAVSSEDVAVVLEEQNSNPGQVRSCASNGLAASDPRNPDWGQVGTDIHLPLLMDGNYGWNTSVTILNYSARHSQYRRLDVGRAGAEPG